MPRRPGPAPVLALAALLAFPAALGAQAKQAQSVTVSDSRQLVKAIGSNKTILLRKGDYRLEDAYAVSTDVASWGEGESGRELLVEKVQNLTIRGVEGSRIVTGAADAYLMGLYNCVNVSFDSIRFVRELGEDEELGAGTFYAESTQSLTFDRCSFQGPTYNALELYDCDDVAVKRTEIRDSRSSALSASNVRGLTLSGGTISGNDGYPLLYLEECSDVAFTAMRFEGNSVGNFIEIYAESGEADGIVFKACVFMENEAEYFSGSQILPETVDCRFEGNSFDENWAEDSVAPYQDEGYAGEDGGPAYYEHYASGLAFYYPPSWELSESEDQSRVGLYSPDNDAVVLFTTPFALPAKADPAKQAKKLLADAGAAYLKLLKSEMGLTAAIKAEGEPYDAGGFTAQDFRGSATKGQGEKAFLRVRLFINGGAVHAMTALGKDESVLDADTDADYILYSVVLGEEGGE